MKVISFGIPCCEDAMARPKFVVRLSAEERRQLREVIRRGAHGARRVTRARILLKADDGLTDAAIATALDVGVATVHRIRQRGVEEGRAAALTERPRPGAAPPFNPKPSPSARDRAGL